MLRDVNVFILNIIQLLQSGGSAQEIMLVIGLGVELGVEEGDWGSEYRY